MIPPVQVSSGGTRSPSRRSNVLSCWRVTPSLDARRMASLAASNCASAFKGHFGGSTLVSVVSGSATAVYILLRWRGGLDGASAAADASRAAA